MTAPVPQTARDTIDRYRLRHGSTVDTAHLPLVRELALLGAPATADAAQRHCRAVTSLIGFHEKHGLPVDRATLLRPDIVARHLSALAPILEAQSVRMHAVSLQRIALADKPGPTRTEPRLPTDPYSPADVQRLLDWADATADPQVRHGLLGILAFGLGAGLNSSDLAELDGPDISPRGPGAAVTVEVRGLARPDRKRTVPLLEPYERLGRELAAAAGNGWLLRPWGAPAGPRNWKPIVFAGRPDPRLPDLNPRRCRRTWQHTHLEGGTPVKALMRAAGQDRTYYLVAPTRRLDPLPPADRDTELRRHRR